MFGEGGEKGVFGEGGEKGVFGEGGGCLRGLREDSLRCFMEFSRGVF